MDPGILGQPEMTIVEGTLLISGGLVAGIINTLAGAGSSLTVPLLVLVGLPGNVANGTNRIGVLLQCLTAAWRFRAEGVSGFREALPMMLPVGIGAAIGAVAISQVDDESFEFLFGIIMILLLIPLVYPWKRSSTASSNTRSRTILFVLLFAIGVYGGAFQAGVGLALIAVLSYAGHDLVHTNSIKVVINSALTGAAIPIFFLQDQIAWIPGLTLATGFILGGEIGARIAVRGGERVIRPALAIAILLLAGRMLGLY